MKNFLKLLIAIGLAVTAGAGCSNMMPDQNRLSLSKSLRFLALLWEPGAWSIFSKTAITKEGGATRTRS